MLNLAFSNGAKKDDAESHPNNGDEDVYGPLKFCVFFAAGNA